MIGVLPVGMAHRAEGSKVAFFWSLKIADADAIRQAGLARWKAGIADYWPQTLPFLDQIADWDQLALARYAHRTALPPHADGIVFIGDSAHSTSPQLGQGANMALLDAAALAHALSSARSVEEALASYAAARRNHVRLFQLLSYVFTPFYQSDSRAIAWLRDRWSRPSQRSRRPRSFWHPSSPARSPTRSPGPACRNAAGWRRRSAKPSRQAALLATSEPRAKSTAAFAWMAVESKPGSGRAWGSSSMQISVQPRMTQSAP